MPNARKPLELDPAEISDLEARERARIQALFHGLIRSRAHEGGLPIPRRLPSIATMPVAKREPRWFPVRGMYGGFNYVLNREYVREREEFELQLITESRCRVAEGSERCHIITAEQLLLSAS